MQNRVIEKNATKFVEVCARVNGALFLPVKELFVIN